MSHINMNFADKIRYDRLFQQVARKGVELSINDINIFQHAQYLSVSVVNSYTEYCLMHIFLDNFHQGGKYTGQIASDQE